MTKNKKNKTGPNKCRENLLGNWKWNIHTSFFSVWIFSQISSHCNCSSSCRSLHRKSFFLRLQAQRIITFFSHFFWSTHGPWWQILGHWWPQVIFNTQTNISLSPLHCRWHWWLKRIAHTGTYPIFSNSKSTGKTNISFFKDNHLTHKGRIQVLVLWAKHPSLSHSL